MWKFNQTGTLGYTPSVNLLWKKNVQQIIQFSQCHARETLDILSQLSQKEAGNCSKRFDTSTAVLRSCYTQSGASYYNLDEAFQALLIPTARSKRATLQIVRNDFLKSANTTVKLVCWFGWWHHPTSNCTAKAPQRRTQSWGTLRRNSPMRQSRPNPRQRKTQPLPQKRDQGFQLRVRQILNLFKN